ncbi:MAG: hypothetical protein F2667_04080, partial [Actinobacteria bacterium]|nr:hypothetical protein [Actinomycetota bacterium]
MTRTSATTARAASSGLVLALTAGLLALGLAVGTPAAHAAGATLVSDGLRAGTTSGVAVGFSTPGLPCLTAGGPMGCAAVSDAPGSGVLRLTDAANAQLAGLTYPTALSLDHGLRIEFSLYQYGGTGSDGTSFMLATGPTPPPNLGQPGASLGYSGTVAAGSGVLGGYLGIGFDTDGDFGTDAASGSGCPVTGLDASQAGDQVSVRGPGYSLDGYCLLGSSAVDHPVHPSLRGADRASSRRDVQIVVDPALGPQGTYVVSVDFRDGAGPVELTRGDLPADHIDLATGLPAPGLPPSVTATIAGSTGGADDIHEISDLTITTLDSPALGLTDTLDVTSVAPGSEVTYTLTPSVLDVAESQPASITVTDALPAGVTTTATPFGDDWDCTASSAATVACSYLGASAPVGALPAITVEAVVDPATPVGQQLSDEAQVTSANASSSALASAALTIAASPATPIRHRIRLVTTPAPDGTLDPVVERLDGGVWSPALAYTNPAYQPLPGAGYVGDGPAGAPAELEYRIPFDLPAGATDVRLRGRIFADDGADVVLGGLSVGTSGGFTGVPGTLQTASPAAFRGGRNDLSVLVHNFGGGPAGFALKGSVTYSTYPVPAAGAANRTWPLAEEVAPGTTTTATLGEQGEALWYRFPVAPDSRISVGLTGLGADYDLTVFRDISQAFDDVETTEDLALLGAEFASDAFSPSAFSPSAFSPSAFSPSAFSPSAFSPSAFSPSAFSPSAFSPSAFSPSAFSPSAFSPSAFSPDNDPAAVVDPGALSATELAESFSSAQTRSLIAVSANDGTVDESVRASTWDATGYFYARVVGRNGAFGAPFSLRVDATAGACAPGLSSFAATPSLPTVPDGARTVILTDSSLLPGSSSEAADLMADLAMFAARPEIDGVVVDAADSARIRALRDQAALGANIDCPYATNLVAQGLRDLVNGYRGPEDRLRYVVIAGDDSVVPFFRSADAAGLGPEQNYVPPMRDATASEASLRRNQVLSQDAYGAERDLTLKGATVALPDLAVGRLVETPQEIGAALERYTDLDTTGVLPTPTSMLATGYDFLTDAADELSEQWQRGLGPDATVDELITDSDIARSVVTVDGVPDRRHSWTAQDLRHALLDSGRHDLVYLAGHFGANSTLAADYRTSLVTVEVARDADPGLFADTLVISAGCHSGYNIVDGEGVRGLTLGLDWAQLMAQQGATLVAGTGYQYGDTDFVEYSERLYADFAAQLRVGTGPVPLGEALLRAKQDYLATTPVLSGIHQKALAEATLYGLPMLAIDMPGERTAVPGPVPVAADPVVTGPGARLGLVEGSVDTGLSTTTVTKPYRDEDGDVGRFTYLTGPDGVVTNPGQPALPLESLDVTVEGKALRGAGFWAGDYDDLPGIVPLTGAPATELGEVHTPFRSPEFFPGRLTTINQLGAVIGDGSTRLLVTPAQHRSDSETTSTLRAYDDLDVRLFYSSNTQTYAGGNRPSLAAPPSISGVTSTVDPATGVATVSARVVGDPSAGIQEVWVTRTAESGPWYGEWRSVSLTQDPLDSTLWTGTLDLASGAQQRHGAPTRRASTQQPGPVRFIIQAVNGVGLVSVADNLGASFRLDSSPGLEPVQAQREQTRLVVTAPGTVVVGDRVPVSATLTDSEGRPLPGRTVTLVLGEQTQQVVTDAAGVAATTFAYTGSTGGG